FEVPEKVVNPEDEPRIGVMVCHCGINIGAVVNVPEVVEYVKKLPNVVVAEGNLYSCSSDSQERIKELIAKYDLNRFIVASCTPRTHEMTIAKSRRLQPQAQGEISVIKKVLVIGGGVSGMTAALHVAREGYDVYIVEKAPELGGLLKQLYRVFPSNENAEEVLEKLRSDIAELDKIKVFTNAKLVKVDGYVGNFKIEICVRG
ncbi:MAG: FAD-dependent oxidoreductase, partial [Candidatus Helarchaeota archaeon]